MTTEGLARCGAHSFHAAFGGRRRPASSALVFPHLCDLRDLRVEIFLQADATTNSRQKGTDNMRLGKKVYLVVALSFLALPGDAWAQAALNGAISGTIRDTTGGVLPGVQVEAASPAL